MKIFLFALGLVAGMATEKNATAFGLSCYECYAETGRDNQDCWDESKLNQEKYKCSDGKFTTSGSNVSYFRFGKITYFW